MNTLNDYNYVLPEHLIAQLPVEPRDCARLLVCQSTTTDECIYHDDIFYNLPQYIESWSLMVFNDTKVLHARIPLMNTTIMLPSKKNVLLAIGEVFVYRIVNDYFIEALVSDGKHFKPGSIIQITADIYIQSESFVSDGILMKVSWCTTYQLLDRYWHVPLPPYIESTSESRAHYQTYRWNKQWSVAAPTASLHFTPSLRDWLYNHGVDQLYATLHVWLGTFKPVVSNDIHNHRMHNEQASVSRVLLESIAHHAMSNMSIIWVGTTIVRTLESLPYVYYELLLDNPWFINQQLSSQAQERRTNIIIWLPYTKDLIEHVTYNVEHIAFSTRIFISPGRKWRVCDSMVTNFHLPKTTLIMMVSALLWYNATRQAYKYAIDMQYRFYSYGDGMLIRTKYL